MPVKKKQKTDKISLRCILLPDVKAEEHMCLVEVNREDTVMELKDAIQKKFAPKLDNCPSGFIEVWKCSGFVEGEPIDRTLEDVQMDGTDNRVVRLTSGQTRMSVLFVPVPEEAVHVIVRLPTSEEEEKRREKEEEGTDDEVNWREIYCGRKRVTLAPSDAAAAKFCKFQKDKEQKVYWSRPWGTDSELPVVLYHQIFRNFIDDCKKYRTTANDHKFVLTMMEKMSEYYGTEDLRGQKFRGLLIEYGIEMTAERIAGVKGSDYITDGSLAVKGYSIGVLEVKNEVVGGHAEPYAQAILYYLQGYWEKVVKKNTFKFPCLLICLLGAQIAFVGAVWRSRPHFEMLCPIMPFNFHTSNTEMRRSLARHFGALKKAFLALREHYKILDNPLILKNLQRIYPDPRSYRCLKTQENIDFTYEEKITKKRIFQCVTASGDRIFVKFVKEYSSEAHEKCAEMGFAPKLRGFEEIGAGWKMVIMDAIDEQYITLADQAEHKEGAKEQIKEMLESLHGANFVHGDIRDVNIMVAKNDDTVPQFMLVDFDWAGKIGEAVYPMSVNRENIWRPEGAEDEELIEVEHDMAMLDKIFDEDVMLF